MQSPCVDHRKHSCSHSSCWKCCLLWASPLLYLQTQLIPASGSQLHFCESHTSPTVPLTPGDIHQALWNCLLLVWSEGGSNLCPHFMRVEKMPTVFPFSGSAYTSFFCSWGMCSSFPCQPPSLFIGRDSSSSCYSFYMNPGNLSEAFWNIALESTILTLILMRPFFSLSQGLWRYGDFCPAVIWV